MLLLDGIFDQKEVTGVGLGVLELRFPCATDNGVSIQIYKRVSPNDDAFTWSHYELSDEPVAPSSFIWSGVEFMIPACDTLANWVGYSVHRMRMVGVVAPITVVVPQKQKGKFKRLEERYGIRVVEANCREAQMRSAVDEIKTRLHEWRQPTTQVVVSVDADRGFMRPLWDFDDAVYKLHQDDRVYQASEFDIGLLVYQPAGKYKTAFREWQGIWHQLNSEGVTNALAEALRISIAFRGPANGDGEPIGRVGLLQARYNRQCPSLYRDVMIPIARGTIELSDICVLRSVTTLQELADGVGYGPEVRELL